MTKSKPSEAQVTLEQFSAVEASFRLEGMEKTTYSEAISAAIASGDLTHEEAVAKIIQDAKAGLPPANS